MGMGTYAQFADTVDPEFVKSQCHKELEALITWLEFNSLSLDDIADLSYNNDEEEIDEQSLSLLKEVQEEIDKQSLLLLKEVQEVFQKKTGLSLYLVYHNKDDRGDEIDGYAWAVDGVYALTPAGEQYKDQLSRRFWTVCG